MDLQPKEVTQTPFENKKILLVGLILIIVIATMVSISMFQSFKKPQVKKVSITKQVIKKRSKDSGIISRALTGKEIDLKTGKILTAARIFSQSDKTVYLELDLSNPPTGTLIDYIRYKEEKYVDHGEITIQDPSTDNVLFKWINTKNIFDTTREGKWRVATYTNGILAKKIEYGIINNKVSWIKTQTIKNTDPDYRLSGALSLLIR